VVAARGLSTWEIAGPDLYALAEVIKGRPGVEQVAHFGNTLHVSGQERESLERSLKPLMGGEHLFKPVPTTLEEVFISLMNQPPGS
jgi:ABC-2 type transport system ATP-binding protein